MLRYSPVNFFCFQIFQRISSWLQLRRPSCCFLTRTGRRCGRCCSSCGTWWPAWTRTKWPRPTSPFVWRRRCSTSTPWRETPTHRGELRPQTPPCCLWFTLLVSANISVKDGNEFRMCDPHFHGYISLSSGYIILCCRCGVHSVCWFWFCWTEEQNSHNNSNTSPSLSSVTAHCLCDMSSGVYFPISAVLFMNPCVLEHITKGGCKNYPLETNKTHTVLTGFTLSFRSLDMLVFIVDWSEETTFPWRPFSCDVTLRVGSSAVVLLCFGLQLV